MKFYKLGMDMSRCDDILAHCGGNDSIYLLEMIIGKRYASWDGSFYFTFDSNEGHIPSDYLANDKGWFVVSPKLKALLEQLHTEIQFLPIEVVEQSGRGTYQYFVANVLKLVDALCLERSEYFTLELPEEGPVYSVIKYAIYQDKTDGADVFKLANRQEIPLFVSERFKQAIEEQGITGIALHEIRVA